jgi:hypothetical protein
VATPCIIANAMASGCGPKGVKWRFIFSFSTDWNQPFTMWIQESKYEHDGHRASKIQTSTNDHEQKQESHLQTDLPFLTLNLKAFTRTLELKAFTMTSKRKAFTMIKTEIMQHEELAA